MKENLTIGSLITFVLLAAFFYFMISNNPNNKYKEGQKVYISGIPGVISREPSYFLLVYYKVKYFDRSGQLRDEQFTENELEALITQP